MIREEEIQQPNNIDRQQKQSTVQQPKETLYIHNINEKIKSKDLKYALYLLFEAYGQILQIICKKNNKMRGQAFVVFKQVNEAVMAKNSLNGYPIFGKNMKIEFSRKRSKMAAYSQD